MKSTELKTFSIIKALPWATAGGGLLCLAGVLLSPQQFFVSYLYAFVFWWGIAMGSLGLLQLHHLTGGAWGDTLKPLLESSAGTLPWLALLFVPILFGLPVLYPWAQPAVVSQDPLLLHKQLFLNVPFFCIRTLCYFAIWWRLTHHRSAGGLILFVLTVTFAAVDWMMSIEPHWYSTVYGILVMMGGVLSAVAFTICAAAWLHTPEFIKKNYAVKPILDTGNLLLAFVMVWAYLTLSQYLVIWSANLPEEITWYLHRQQGGWFWVAMLLVACHWALPFLALLIRRNKQDVRRLCWIAAFVLMMRPIEIFWLIQPPFHPEHFHIHILDAVTLFALGSAWLWLFSRERRRWPEAA